MYDLKISFEVPSEIRNGFAKTTQSIRNHILRQALRSSLLPARNRLKANILSITQNSRQATGATLRSLTTKYRNSRNNPDKFYGIVGVNRKYVEAIWQGPPLLYNTVSRHRQVSFGIWTYDKRTGEKRYQKRYPRQEVRSYLRRRKIPTRLKRQPSKYLHLLEAGFTHWRSREPVPGKEPVLSAQMASEAECRAIFRSKMLDHFKRLFQ